MNIHIQSYQPQESCSAGILVWSLLFLFTLFFIETASATVNENVVKISSEGSFIGNMTPDGRLLVFSRISEAAGESKNKRNIYVFNNETGTSTLVSVSVDGVESNGLSSSPFISSNGKFVVFSSNATDLVPDIISRKRLAYLRDLDAGTTEIVSLASDGRLAASGFAVVNADGRFVAFESEDPVVNPGAFNEDGTVKPATSVPEQIFRHDRLTGETLIVSTNAAGTLANSGAQLPTITDNGQVVVFSSISTNLVANDTNKVGDMFRRDFASNDPDEIMVRLSVDSDGNQANAGSSISFPSHRMSGDGQFILFASRATNLVENDTNGKKDLFVRKLTANPRKGQTLRISVDSNGTGGNQDSLLASISADGRLVVFTSAASNLDPTTTDSIERIFVHDLASLSTSVVIDRGSIFGRERIGARNSLGIGGGMAISTRDRTIAFNKSNSDTGTFESFVADIPVSAFPGDRDGDGIPDSLENQGQVDIDGDGVADILLDPNHKDLFLEIDWIIGEEPTRSVIQAVKSAFALAPLDAGGIPNPDGQPGINLWIDTGNLVDATAAEGSGTCGDGLDNDSDGFTDGDDSDCLVGDNLGGGNAIDGSSLPSVLNSVKGTLFYQLKNGDVAAGIPTNFDKASRKNIFRYGIFGPSNNLLGGQAEIGGNDLVSFNGSANILMHELGHNLGLRHGGADDVNCKPNYLSIMNYSHTPGVLQRRNRRGLLDFSPPRLASGGRAQAPLPTLFEDNLDETLILDSTDDSSLTVFINGRDRLEKANVDAEIDWDGFSGANDVGVTVNLDTAVLVSGFLEPSSRCENDETDNVLTGHDDWSAVSLPFLHFGDADDAALNVNRDDDPTLEEINALEDALNQPPAWEPGTTYATGDLVTFGDVVFQCIQGHTALSVWEPPIVPALWQIPTPDDTPPSEWAPNTIYKVTSQVVFEGELFEARIAHTSVIGETPSIVPAVWVNLSTQ